MNKRNPKDLLKYYWGFDSFRGSQQKVIDALMNGQDAVALMPTGGGKSVCFQIPALAQEGICIVISPLVALIQNQVARLKLMGIKAIALTGGIPMEEVGNLLDNCLYGNYTFLYLSPERLRQELVRGRIQRMKVRLIAIDEAHCISQWGHDFRPAYLECGKLRELLPDTPMVALTATATEQVIADIAEHLKLQAPVLVKDSFARKNIAFSVVFAEDKPYRLKQLCASLTKSAIVYVRTRRLAEELARYLNASDYEAAFFHGGVSKSEKQKRLDLWLENKVKIMVATNAFGMGIDKADVALVVHYQIPDCIENYFQEAGRAGRDGTHANAVLLTNKTDQQGVKDQFIGVLPDTQYLKMVYNKLNNYFQIAYGEGNDTTHQLNFNAFCDTYKLNSLLTYNSFRILDQNSVFSLTEAFTQKTMVQLLIGKEPLFAYLEQHQGIVPVVQTLLRTYGGLFDFETKINTHLVAKKSGVSETQVLASLKQLEKDAIIAHQANESDLSITFLVPREDDTTIHRFAREVAERQQVKIDQVHQMLEYVNNNTQCRNRQLLDYFGEKATAACGICDVCKRNRIVDPATEAQQILKLLEHAPYDSRFIIAALNKDEQQILRSLQHLLEEGMIRINSTNKYELI